PILGAAFFLAFRDVLSDFTEHWMLFFGPLLVARVLLVKDGIWGMLVRATGADDKLGEPKVDFPDALERAADSKPGATKSANCWSGQGICARRSAPSSPLTT